MKEMDDQKENIQGRTGIMDMIRDIKLDADKKEKIVIFFLLGVFFLLIATPVSDLTGNRKKQKSTKTGTSQQTQQKKIQEKDAYITALENKLEQTIEGMEGAGKVDVMITLKDNGEKILDKNQPYESEEETNTEENKESKKNRIQNNQETVLVETEGNTEPIIVRELYPDIEGVVVVCEGGDNSALTVKIKEAVQALFSIDAHKIVVCKSK
ncbi:putative stage III sporulation protein AG [Clostridium sp. CAG:590]|jgi:stage III sporulation protein AG|nr:putative stage III sporulation protein AG [Clostridium sp. CAG:590]